VLLAAKANPNLYSPKVRSRTRARAHGGGLCQSAGGGKSLQDHRLHSPSESPPFLCRGGGRRNRRVPNRILMGRVASAPQDKTTPLFIAAQGRHAGVVRALVEAGATVDVECGDAALTEVGSDFRDPVLCWPAGVSSFAFGCTAKPPPAHRRNLLPVKVCSLRRVRPSDPPTPIPSCC
jgi:hypothetical protein